VRRLRAEGVEFVDRAPRVFVFESVLDAGIEAVWAAISADPVTWTWFPGLRDAAYLSPAPHGVGSTRQVTMSGTVYRETILAWDPPTRWAYRVDECSAPMAEALVEDWTLSSDHYAGGTVTVVRWSFAVDPGPVFRLGLFAAPHVMGSLFRRAMQNLDRELVRRVVDVGAEV
jgi:uncharacterized protein YndB with AHSA1/START domain